MKKDREQATSTGAESKRRRVIIRMVVAGCAITLLALLLSMHVFAGQQALPAQQAVLTAAALGLDDISISAAFSPDDNSLTATQSMRLQNRSGQALSDVVIRTYANAFSSEEYSPAAIEDVYDRCYYNGFTPGGITMMKVLADGQSARYSYDDAAKTVLRISLDAGWQPGEWVDIVLDYAIKIPYCNYRFGYSSGIYTLGNTFPVLSVWEDGSWRTEEYFPLGDPFYSNCANYSVTIAVPKGYLCAGSAYAEKSEKDGQWIFSFDAPAIRDFALAISDRFLTAQETVGNVLITSYALNAKDAQKALKYSRQALICFNELYGDYPYRHLAVANVDFPFGGMEYPGLILIQRALFGQENDTNLEIVAVHEVAHQWWYAVVGSDQYYQPWQDEALAEYSLLDYTARYYGQDARESIAFSRFETAMRVTIPRGVTPGSPIDYFGSMSEYSLVVYRRGAAMLVALDTALGDKFHEFLRAYYREHAFQLAGREDFVQTLKNVTGQDWSALMTDYLDTYIAN